MVEEVKIWLCTGSGKILPGRCDREMCVQKGGTMRLEEVWVLIMCEGEMLKQNENIRDRAGPKVQ